MSACVITRRTICGFAALTSPPTFLYQFLRARACLCVYVRVRISMRMWMSGWNRQASPGEPYRRFLGERVEASPGSLWQRGKGERRWGDTRESEERTTGVEEATGYPIRRRVSRRQLPATPTRYATVIPWLLSGETRVEVWLDVTHDVIAVIGSIIFCIINSVSRACTHAHIHARARARACARFDWFLHIYIFI